MANQRLSRSYLAYISSREWLRRKAGFFAFYRRQCRSCGSRELIDLHHLTYERFGRERRGDLIPLCRGCHDEAHRLHVEHPGSTIAQVTKHVVDHHRAITKSFHKQEREMASGRPQQTEVTREASGQHRRKRKASQKKPIAQASRTSRPYGGEVAPNPRRGERRGRAGVDGSGERRISPAPTTAAVKGPDR
mgnify:CR=1 FL=1